MWAMSKEYGFVHILYTNYSNKVYLNIVILKNIIYNIIKIWKEGTNNG